MAGHSGAGALEPPIGALADLVFLIIGDTRDRMFCCAYELVLDSAAARPALYCASRKARLGRLLGGAKSSVPGSDDGLGAVGDLQFGEDVRNVIADGLRAEEQRAGYVGVAAPSASRASTSRSRSDSWGNAVGCRGAVPLR